jgi:poly(A) polymerase
MTRVTGDWLTAHGTQTVLALLEGAGHQAYAVGGCVRNALFGQAVADVDITTEARPERVIALARAVGIRAVPTGIDHGTVTLVVDEVGYEVTTFRKDVETDGRRATIAYADTLDEDAHRRDFTINALYARADGTVIDPLGGLDDIHARRVRFIDDAGARIAEDYLRILRFFRFQAWYGDPDEGIDPDTLAACAELADGIDRLSRERIGGEMTKLLAAPDPAPALAAMATTGILGRVLPGASTVSLAVLVHLEQEVAAEPDWRRRLAILGAEDVEAALRLSRADLRHLGTLRDALAAGTSAEEIAWRTGGAAGLDLALVRAASSGQKLASGFRDRLRHAEAARFPVRAKDLMPGLTGPALGRRLAEIERRWIDSGFTLGREELLA